MAHPKGSVDAVSRVMEKETEGDEGDAVVAVAPDAPAVAAAAAAVENDDGGTKNDDEDDDNDDNDDDGGGGGGALASDAPDSTDPTPEAAAVSAETTSTNAAAPPLPPPPKTTTTTPPALSGFFSRAAATVQQAHHHPVGLRLGDAYDLARRRAEWLREGALAEVERLRQQQGGVAQPSSSAEEERAIPPPAGVLVVGDPPPPAKTDGDGCDSGGGGEAVAVVTDDGDATAPNAGGEAMGAKTTSTSTTTSTTTTTKTKTTNTTKTTKTTTALQDAFNMVRKTSKEAADRLIFPIDAFSARNDMHDDDEEEDDDDDDENINSSSNEEEYYSSSSGDNGSIVRDGGSEEEGDSVDKGRVRDGGDDVRGGEGVGGSGNNDNEGGSGGGRNDDENDAGVKFGAAGAATAAAAALNLTPTRFASATNSVLNAAVGRYRRLRENALFDNASSPLPPTSPPCHPQQQATHHRNRQEEKGDGAAVVGGAAWVSGMHNFPLDGLFDNNKPPPPPADVVGGSTFMPPSMPFSKVSEESKCMRVFVVFESPYHFKRGHYDRISMRFSQHLESHNGMVMASRSSALNYLSKPHKATAGTRRPHFANGRTVDDGVEPRSECRRRGRRRSLPGDHRRGRTQRERRSPPHPIVFHRHRRERGRLRGRIHVGQDGAVAGGRRQPQEAAAIEVAIASILLRGGRAIRPAAGPTRVVLWEGHHGSRFKADLPCEVSSVSSREIPL